MAELFDKAVGFLGAGASLQALATGSGAAATDEVGVAATLAVPVVIANLARMADVDATRLTADLATIEPADDAGLASLATAPGRWRAGAVADALLGPRRRRVVGMIAERSRMTDEAVDGVLDATTWVVLAELGRMHRAGLDEPAMAVLLRTEREELATVGWGPWLGAVVDDERAAQASAPSSLPVSGRRPVTDRSAYPPPRRSDRGEPSAAEPPSGRRSASILESEALDGEPGRGRGARSGSGPEPASTRRPVHSRRRLGLLLTTALVVGIGAAALLVTLGSDAAGNGASGDDVDAGRVGPIDDVASDAAPDVGAATAGGGDGGPRSVPEAPGPELIEIPVALTDPLGRTTATAEGVFTFYLATGKICYDLTVDGLTGPYDGHVHVGPGGVKGGIVVDLGPLDGSPVGCIDSRAVDTAAILADRAGHYVELHDAGGTVTIRQQLAASEPGGDDRPSGEEGARLVVETGVIVMEGEVPDQETADKFAESFADLDLGATRLVDELVVVEGAPRPSGRIVVGDAIEFDFDSAELTDPGAAVFEVLATVFRARPAWTMTVVGHTDGSGTEVYNLELSLRRAEAVRDALVERGIDPDVLAVQGAGSTDPVADNGSSEGRARNRRIEFEIVAR